MTQMSVAQVTQKLTAPGAPFEMEELDINGLITRVWKHSPQSLREVFDTMRGYGDREFIIYQHQRMTYAQHDIMVRKLASVLVDQYGIKKGDRVAIAMRNMPEWSVCFWAGVVAGAIVVPLNAWWTGPELEYGLTDSGSCIVFVDQQRADSLVEHYANLHLVAAVCAGAHHNLPDNVVELDSLIADVPDDVALPEVELLSDDEATIFYTSGTTGKPKGALGTHRNICSCLTALEYAGARTLMRSGVKPPAERTILAPLLSVPLFHATGCHANLVSHGLKGNKLIMMYKWDPEEALDLIERERATGLGGVPAMAWQLIEYPGAETRDLSSLVNVGYGGAPSAPELQTRINEVIPHVSTSNGYGLTESSAALTVCAGIDYIMNPGSVGVPVAINDVKLMDADGESEVAPGEIGEIWARGANIVKGYWNKPQATAETFRDGWLVTGDLARIDDEGFVYIVDRAKDMLIRGGENVYCVEVENALYRHPQVMDVAVVGVPDKVLGEEVGAVVQLTPDADVNSEQLQVFLRETLAAFMVPKYILLRTQPLARNANGKILKPEAKAILLQSLSMAAGI